MEFVCFNNKRRDKIKKTALCFRVALRQENLICM